MLFTALCFFFLYPPFWPLPSEVGWSNKWEKLQTEDLINQRSYGNSHLTCRLEGKPQTEGSDALLQLKQDHQSGALNDLPGPCLIFCKSDCDSLCRLKSWQAFKGRALQVSLIWTPQVYDGEPTMKVDPGWQSRQRSPKCRRAWQWPSPKEMLCLP